MLTWLGTRQVLRFEVFGEEAVMPHVRSALLTGHDSESQKTSLDVARSVVICFDCHGLVFVRGACSSPRLPLL